MDLKHFSKKPFDVLCIGITVLYILYDNSFCLFCFHFLCGTGPVQVVCKIGPFPLYKPPSLTSSSLFPCPYHLLPNLGVT